MVGSTTLNHLQFSFAAAGRQSCGEKCDWHLVYKAVPSEDDASFYDCEKWSYCQSHRHAEPVSHDYWVLREISVIKMTMKGFSS